jgi:hypothetical protein
LDPSIDRVSGQNHIPPMQIAQAIKAVPLLGPALVRSRAALLRRTFRGSAAYWETRYRRGGNSGAGSQSRLARFKADAINGLVGELGIASVIEFGCGDGLQLRLADYPAYIGIDVSRTALELCAKRNPRAHLIHADDYAGETADLALSLDVIYHLIEDEVFDAYMRRLFAAAERFVLIYSPDFADRRLDAPHVRTRRFSDWIAEHAPEWRLARHIPNAYPLVYGDPATSFSDFYLYQRR